MLINGCTLHLCKHSFDAYLKFYYAYEGILGMEHLISKVVQVRSQKPKCTCTQAYVYTRQKLSAQGCKLICTMLQAQVYIEQNTRCKQAWSIYMFVHSDVNDNFTFKGYEWGE